MTTTTTAGPRPGFNRVAVPLTDHPERYGPTPFVHHEDGCKGAHPTDTRIGWTVQVTDNTDGLIECGNCLRSPAVRRALAD